MTAHTKGPWSCHHNGHYWEFTSNEFQLGDVCASQFTDPGTEEANARLIASAPELLEALELIARPHDCGCKPCTGACRNQLALEITVEEIQELARAAIAKAKGEQP